MTFQQQNLSPLTGVEIRLRRTLSDAANFIAGTEASRQLGAVTLEEAIQAQRDRIALQLDELDRLEEELFGADGESGALQAAQDLSSSGSQREDQNTSSSSLTAGEGVESEITT